MKTPASEVPPSSEISLVFKILGSWVLVLPRNCYGTDPGEQPLVQTHRGSEHQHGNRFFFQNGLEKRLGTVVLLRAKENELMMKMALVM